MIEIRRCAAFVVCAAMACGPLPSPDYGGSEGSEEESGESSGGGGGGGGGGSSDESEGSTDGDDEATSDNEGSGGAGGSGASSTGHCDDSCAPLVYVQTKQGACDFYRCVVANCPPGTYTNPNPCLDDDQPSTSSKSGAVPAE